MLRSSVTLGSLLLIVMTSGCNSGRHSPAGFRLPDGEAERGKAAFAALECHSCHEVAGSDLPKPTRQPRIPVRLGGEVARHMTDGYLVSAIVNPSHVVVGYPREMVQTAEGKSRMPEFADSMTVRELADIVAFLQSQYKYAPPLPKAPAPNC